MSIVTTHPAPLDLVAFLRSIQSLPQICIFNRFPGSGFPATCFPAMYPLTDTLLYILTVGMHDHFTRAIKDIQRFDHSTQFHTIISRREFAAKDFLLVFTHDQQCSPATTPRVSFAGTIGINMYFTHYVLFR